MTPEEIFEELPFADHIGLELDWAEDGRARGHVDLKPEHSSNPTSMIAHGGVAYSLADTLGGVALSTVNDTVVPTIDMRIDYLAPATGDRLEAEATVVRNGGSVATVDVEVTDGEGTDIATLRGVYKTGGADRETPWTSGREN